MPCPKPLFATLLCINSLFVYAQSSDTTTTTAATITYFKPHGVVEIGFGVNVANYFTQTSTLPLVNLELGVEMPINPEFSAGVSLQPLSGYPFYKITDNFLYQATIFGNLNFFANSTLHSRSRVGFYTGAGIQYYYFRTYADDQPEFYDDLTRLTLMGPAYRAGIRYGFKDGTGALDLRFMYGTDFNVRQKENFEVRLSIRGIFD